MDIRRAADGSILPYSSSSRDAEPHVTDNLDTTFGDSEDEYPWLPDDILNIGLKSHSAAAISRGSSPTSPREDLSSSLLYVPMDSEPTRNSPDASSPSLSPLSHISSVTSIPILSSPYASHALLPTLPSAISARSTSPTNDGFPNENIPRADTISPTDDALDSDIRPNIIPSSSNGQEDAPQLTPSRPTLDTRQTPQEPASTQTYAHTLPSGASPMPQPFIVSPRSIRPVILEDDDEDITAQVICSPRKLQAHNTGVARQVQVVKVVDVTPAVETMDVMDMSSNEDYSPVLVPSPFAAAATEPADKTALQDTTEASTQPSIESEENMLVEKPSIPASASASASTRFNPSSLSPVEAHSTQQSEARTTVPERYAPLPIDDAEKPDETRNAEENLGKDTGNSRFPFRKKVSRPSSAFSDRSSQLSIPNDDRLSGKTYVSLIPSQMVSTSSEQRPFPSTNPYQQPLSNPYQQLLSNTYQKLLGTPHTSTILSTTDTILNTTDTILNTTDRTHTNTSHHAADAVRKADAVHKADDVHKVDAAYQSDSKPHVGAAYDMNSTNARGLVTNTQAHQPKSQRPSTAQRPDAQRPYATKRHAAPRPHSALYVSHGKNSVQSGQPDEDHHDIVNQASEPYVHGHNRPPTASSRPSTALSRPSTASNCPSTASNRPSTASSRSNQYTVRAQDASLNTRSTDMVTSGATAESPSQTLATIAQQPVYKLRANNPYIHLQRAMDAVQQENDAVHSFTQHRRLVSKRPSTASNTHSTASSTLYTASIRSSAAIRPATAISRRVKHEHEPRRQQFDMPLLEHQPHDTRTSETWGSRKHSGKSFPDLFFSSPLRLSPLVDSYLHLHLLSASAGDQRQDAAPPSVASDITPPSLGGSDAKHGSNARVSAVATAARTLLAPLHSLVQRAAVYQDAAEIKVLNGEDDTDQVRTPQEKIILTMISRFSNIPRNALWRVAARMYELVYTCVRRAMEQIERTVKFTQKQTPSHSLPVLSSSKRPDLGSQELTTILSQAKHWLRDAFKGRLASPDTLPSSVTSAATTPATPTAVQSTPLEYATEASPANESVVASSQRDGRTPADTRTLFLTAVSEAHAEEDEPTYGKRNSYAEATEPALSKLAAVDNHIFDIWFEVMTMLCVFVDWEKWTLLDSDAFDISWKDTGIQAFIKERFWDLPPMTETSPTLDTLPASSRKSSATHANAPNGSQPTNTSAAVAYTMVVSEPPTESNQTRGPSRILRSSAAPDAVTQCLLGDGSATFRKKLQENALIKPISLQTSVVPVISATASSAGNNHGSIPLVSYNPETQLTSASTDTKTSTSKDKRHFPDHVNIFSAIFSHDARGLPRVVVVDADGVSMRDLTEPNGGSLEPKPERARMKKMRPSKISENPEIPEMPLFQVSSTGITTTRPHAGMVLPSATSLTVIRPRTASRKIQNPDDTKILEDSLPSPTTHRDSAKSISPDALIATYTNMRPVNIDPAVVSVSAPEVTDFDPRISSDDAHLGMLQEYVPDISQLVQMHVGKVDDMSTHPRTMVGQARMAARAVKIAKTAVMYIRNRHQFLQQRQNIMFQKKQYVQEKTEKITRIRKEKQQELEKFRNPLSGEETIQNMPYSPHIGMKFKKATFHASSAAHEETTTIAGLLTHDNAHPALLHHSQGTTTMITHPAYQPSALQPSLSSASYYAASTSITTPPPHPLGYTIVNDASSLDAKQLKARAQRDAEQRLAQERQALKDAEKRARGEAHRLYKGQVQCLLDYVSHLHQDRAVALKKHAEMIRGYTFDHRADGGNTTAQVNKDHEAHHGVTHERYHSSGTPSLAPSTDRDSQSKRKPANNRDYLSGKTTRTNVRPTVHDERLRREQAAHVAVDRAAQRQIEHYNRQLEELLQSQRQELQNVGDYKRSVVSSEMSFNNAIQEYVQLASGKHVRLGNTIEAQLSQIPGVAKKIPKPTDFPDRTITGPSIESSYVPSLTTRTMAASIPVPVPNTSSGKTPLIGNSSVGQRFPFAQRQPPQDSGDSSQRLDSPQYLGFSQRPDVSQRPSSAQRPLSAALGDSAAHTTLTSRQIYANGNLSNPTPAFPTMNPNVVASLPQESLSATPQRKAQLSTPLSWSEQNSKTHALHSSTDRREANNSSASTPQSGLSPSSTPNNGSFLSQVYSAHPPQQRPSSAVSRPASAIQRRSPTSGTPAKPKLAPQTPTTPNATTAGSREAERGAYKHTGSSPHAAGREGHVLGWSATLQSTPSRRNGERDDNLSRSRPETAPMTRNRSKIRGPAPEKPNAFEETLITGSNWEKWVELSKVTVPDTMKTCADPMVWRQRDATSLANAGPKPRFVVDMRSFTADDVNKNK